MSEWIDIKDELPPEGTKVLGLYSYSIYGAEIITVMWSRSGGWDGLCLCPSISLHVSHWRRMIDLPEEYHE